MILGECPYEDCDGHHMLGVPEVTPKFGKETCEKCGREYWMYYSRFEPEAYTPEQFAEKWSVDEETKVITQR